MRRRTGRGPAKFDENEIRRMREARLEGTPIADIARAHDTSPATVTILTRGVKLPRMTPVKGERARAQALGSEARP